MNLTQTQKTILSILFFEKESSRSLLARHLSLTNAALTLAIKPLLEEGMVKENRKESNQKVGRKELRLSLNPSYATLLGIDVRKHNEYYCLTDFSGNAIKESDSSKTTITEFCGTSIDSIIGIGISVRGEPSLEAIKGNKPGLFERLAIFNKPLYIFNNVSCLADIYEGFHPEDKNFLLVKYGPGLGSAIHINGKPLGFSSELGHTLYQGKTVEETISYSAILKREMDESEGTRLILNNDELKNAVIKALCFALYNADSLLGLQKIILSGELLSCSEILGQIKRELKTISKDFDETKICIYDCYAERNAKKSCFGAFIKLFGSL